MSFIWSNTVEISNRLRIVYDLQKSEFEMDKFRPRGIWYG